MEITDAVAATSEVLEHIASAACERTVALVNGDDERADLATGEFESALHRAVTEHARLADIARAEQSGVDRAKDLLRREVLRGIEKGAKARREGQVAWETAIRRGGRLGLGNVEIADAAGVTHAAIRKLLDRPQQPSDTDQTPEAHDPNGTEHWQEAADA